MTKEEITRQLAASAQETPLDPTAVYDAEHHLIAANKDLFFSRKFLDEVLPDDNCALLFTKLIALENVIHDMRNDLNVITNQNASLGKGFRNMGFMVAANQSINNFPALSPTFFTIDDFNAAVGDYQLMRNISERLTALTSVVREMMNVYGNLGFNFSLAYYANVRMIANRSGDQTAMSVFNILRQYFRSRRTSQNANEPGERQLVHDMHALLHGQKEGEIMVEGKAVHAATTGEHTVMDTAHKPAVETLRATSLQVCTACNTENAGHAKFCINCGKQLRMEN